MSQPVRVCHVVSSTFVPGQVASPRGHRAARRARAGTRPPIGRGSRRTRSGCRAAAGTATRRCRSARRAPYTSRSERNPYSRDRRERARVGSGAVRPIPARRRVGGAGEGNDIGAAHGGRVYPVVRRSLGFAANAAEHHRTAMTGVRWIRPRPSRLRAARAGRRAAGLRRDASARSSPGRSSRRSATGARDALARLVGALRRRRRGVRPDPRRARDPRSACPGCASPRCTGSRTTRTLPERSGGRACARSRPRCPGSGSSRRAARSPSTTAARPTRRRPSRPWPGRSPRSPSRDRAWS